MSALGLGAVRCCFAISTSSGMPSNGCLPVSASNRMTPTAYQSDSGPTGIEAACSGDMYAMVPTTRSLERSLAAVTKPKSRSTTRPPRETMMLDGLMSRWTKPARWSAASPPASWRSAARRRSWSQGSPSPSPRSRRGLT